MNLEQAISKLEEQEQSPAQQERNVLALLEELPSEAGSLPIGKPRNVKQLRPIDKYILVLHLRGFKGTQIAKLLGISTEKVYNFLRSDKARELAEDYHSFIDEEHKALYSEAVDALRRGLRSQDPDIFLRAAKMFFDTGGRKSKSDGSLSAEDYISRIIELNQQGQVTKIQETKKLGGRNDQYSSS